MYCCIPNNNVFMGVIFFLCSPKQKNYFICLSGMQFFFIKNENQIVFTMCYFDTGFIMKLLVSSHRTFLLFNLKITWVSCDPRGSHEKSPVW